MNVTSGVGHIATNPEQTDGFAIVFEGKKLDPEVRDALSDNPNAIAILGRSALCQLGLDFYYDSPIARDDGMFVAPIDIETHTETAARLIEDIASLRQDKFGRYRHERQPLSFGRVLDERKLQRMDKDEVEQALRENLIFVGNTDNGHKDREPEWIINDDGSITLPLAHFEFLFNANLLADSRERRLHIVHHGRAGLRPYVDSAEREADESLSPFTVSGVAFSSGLFSWRIRRLVSGGQYLQLDSGSFGDGNRINGVGAHLPPYERHRQVELAWGKTGQQLSYGDAKVTVELFRPSSDQVAVDWSSRSLRDRAKVHLYGLDGLSFLRTRDRAKFDGIFTRLTSEDLNAIVITPQGNARVPVGDSAYFNAQNIQEAVSKLEGSRRYGLRDLKKFSEILSQISDRGRVVFAHSLLPKYVTKVVAEQDVNGLLVKDWGGTSFTKEDHSAMTTLVRRGVNIGWQTDNELRELHRSGLWIRPEATARLEDLDLVIAMYGGNRDIIGNALTPNIKKFMAGLAGIMEPYHLGIAHGNGPGVMRVADEQARRHGFMSLGVGIDTEKIGQGSFNSLPDGVVQLRSRDRQYRQAILDTLNTIAIFNIGGTGTEEELFVSMTTMKLLDTLPTPKIAIAEDDFFDHTKAQIEEFAKRQYIRVGGERIDIRNNPFLDTWAAEVFHTVRDYDSALAIIGGFVADPKAYWNAAGIPDGAIKLALAEHLERLATVGMHLPEYIHRAALEYSQAA